MLKSKKGYFLWELIVSLLILIMICQTLIMPILKMKIELKNQKLRYEMKQKLALNVVLLENNEELEIDDTYELMLRDDMLCIIWWDLYEKQQIYCKKVWL